MNEMIDWSKNLEEKDKLYTTRNRSRPKEMYVVQKLVGEFSSFLGRAPVVSCVQFVFC
jgi:hypothetical protein